MTHKNNFKLQNTDSNHILSDENSGTFTDLQNNVSSASNTLNLNRNYTYNSTVDGSIDVDGIKINKSLTIDGNGYTIDANNFGRIFNINASDVILKNIIFINSHYAGKGGAIFVCQGNTGIIFDNCSFIDNYAEEGSGIYSNSPINMTGSNFTHNGYDASSYSLNGGAVFINAMAYIEGSYFYNNAASYGGAIYASSRVKISNSNFNSNKGNLGGGAIYFDKNSNNNIISGSNFLSNTASSTNANGSAIHFDGNNNTVLDSYFNNNINTGGYGGAIFANDGTSKLTIIGSTFTNNQAVRRGGAIDAHTSYLTIFNSTFKSNKITGSGDTYGSAINLVGSRALINQSNFEDHTASSGTIYGTINFSSNYGSIFNCTFNNNKATDGGAIRIYSTTHHVNISNCRFTNNQATNHGGAIAWAGSNGILNNSYFEANKVSGGHYYGGAVYAEVTSFKILNNDFRSNLAQTGGYGGAMYINSDDVEIIKCNFSDNQAVGHDGGAILLDMGKKNIIVDECRFMRNYASWLSSAISSFATNVTIKNSYFNGNHNSYKADSGLYGGAVAFKYYGYNKVINCTFESNQNYYGGDIKVHDSSPNIEIY
ncbi:right-handed parallel beta-helix repeat-containing protein, partial [uncultured Methanobrevibacter sp.]|uniref:right-handed parallel beta-helix repeat-containing protein n=1 Tax=uncultured Methanobrevibacter sp. TaxID=253161 RepID=UPI003182E5A0